MLAPFKTGFFRTTIRAIQIYSFKGVESLRSNTVVHVKYARYPDNKIAASKSVFFYGEVVNSCLYCREKHRVY